MNLAAQFPDHVKKNNIFLPQDKLLLAVSGGVDSVVLCELCKQNGFDFAIAHCNFRLRGSESERDEQFVRNMGAQYGVNVYVKQFDTENYAADNKLSIQEAARELRYTWFKELTDLQWTVVNGKLTAAGDSQAVTTFSGVLLLTAHHAGDNIETVMMNFFRGTGLHGLTGIPESAGYLRRPMLAFTREQILNFAAEHKLAYVEDSSNLSNKYTRNFFRNELIPAISKVYPQVSENIQDNITRFRGIEALYKLGVEGLIKKIIVPKGKEIHIPVRKLLGFNNRALIYEIISRYGFSEKQVDELVKLGNSESGRFIQSPSSLYRIIRNRNWFIISDAVPETSAHIIIEGPDQKVLFGAGALKIDKVSNEKSMSPAHIALLDAREVVFPLLLRKWRTGDYFYPLGMKKKKKLARFFIDQKLSATQKEGAWVIESCNRILWVVGHRIDDRAKITETTKEIVRISFTASA